MNQFCNDSATERYFQSLPMSVQESIKQCGLTFRSEADLRACAQQLMGGQSPSVQ
ncbi:hypothetical protein LI291_00915 [Intestinibacillus massiliensis]|uniref:hypothetical protein n=1 Tax=Intestinibacillus massiliensis TaxID=1871029 RepID=UPI00190EBE52|nr:hypothetical protein [Intestinibacillus massiliensis]MCB6364756.1 hypothetical protein [Intestinibacillus massiliensis]